ncbi:MAG: hypothetical protein GY705_18940 [Bacteroidetes bacterium]|nr:hypothetical protein [Bacteroidota bacterium]
MQSKVDIAEDMGLPGLLIQEGFLNALLSGSFSALDQPDQGRLEAALSKGDVLAFLDPASKVGKDVMAHLPANYEWPRLLSSHQYADPDLIRADLFMLTEGERTLFVASASDTGTRKELKALIEHTIQLLNKYKLHKGWFGAYSLLNSVTCTKGHPLEIIGRGMNEGNSWFVFDGYMDFLSKDDLDKWMKQVDLPIVTDAGFAPVYGCRDYDGLQVQSMFTKESWIEYAHKKGGYAFRQVHDDEADAFDYDGYLATEGNKEQIDGEDIPFVLKTGRLDDHALNNMVLFIEKNIPFTRESLWEAILDRRATGVLEHGKMIGPAGFRNALQMLLLDRIFLEEYFNDHIDLKATINGYDLSVTVSNFGESAAYGDIKIVLPEGLSTAYASLIPLDLPANSSKTHHFKLHPEKMAMERTNPVAVHFLQDAKNKSTLAMLDLPPAISMHQVIYGHAPRVNFPVSVHNFSKESSFPVELEVFGKSQKQAQFQAKKTCKAVSGTSENLLFELEVPPGDYEVKVSALGMEYTSQLGVGKAEGKPYVYEVDLNSDGISEIRMENDSVQVTLLATGARVIEYIVKSRDDNLLFKLWPKQSIDHKRPFRRRGFYPFGGFEDFLGQPSMETHQIYDAKILQKEGDYVRVRMSTDYFGNRLEKTFTLYGNSPLLEVRFALDFKNYPEANVIGPQPILELGEKHGTEDVFVVPELDGIKEYRMKPERYFGRVQNLKEGWNAGYDSKEDITFVGAFPVNRPLFLHMWMNHPINNDAHHYYVEFQPWVPIDKMTTSYFTYYLWGAGGPWENGVQALRENNLITRVKK